MDDICTYSLFLNIQINEKLILYHIHECSYLIYIMITDLIKI
jgi:hypothetical protein